jgi:hypothetical protein
VSNKWVAASKKADELLDVDEYIHDDLQDEDINTADRKTLFAGLTLFFTRRAMQSYGDDWINVKKTATEAGAVRVLSGAAFKGGEELMDEGHTILLGVEDDDDAEKLKDEYKKTVYDRGMFAQAIIRAKLELDEEDFML